MDRIDPIAPDRSVPRVDLTYLTPLERERRRRKAVEAWAYSLSETSFPRVSAIPGEATPGVFALKRVHTSAGLST